MEYSENLPRKKNPRENSNPLFSALFLYMAPIFWKFRKKNVTKDDLYEPLMEHKSNKLGCQFETIWNIENAKHTKYALHIALFCQFRWELLTGACATLIYQIAPVIVLPEVVRGLVLYFQKGPTNGKISEAYYYMVLLLFVLLARSFLLHSTLMMMTHICMKMRIACSALIYRKVLRFSQSALSETTVGQIINLLSNDLGKFDQALFYSMSIFTLPILTAISTYQLYCAIGVSSLSGITLLILVLPLQMFLGKLDSKVRLTKSVRTDERLRLMNEIISGINVIKMYTWEEPFAKLVSLARRYEIRANRNHFYIEAIRRALAMFIIRTATFVTIVGFVCLGNNISANTAYFITSVYNNLRVVIGTVFPSAVASIAETYVSLNRIQTLLRFEELQHFSEYSDENQKVSNGINGKELVIFERAYKTPKIILKSVSAKWCKNLPNSSIQNISLTINSSQLVAFVGSVGSGKTTLLNVILKELPISAGILDIHGTVSFASQEPWLFSSTIRQNILFGNHYDEKRYKNVLDVSGLETDLSSFPSGDYTIISDGGKSISGGQRARINLARCIYRQADIYLLDDPLSAVDAKVGKHLYKKCVKTFLKDKICILVTHQLQYLTNVDKIIVLNEGTIVGQGTYHELQESGLNFTTLLKESQSNDQQEETILEAAALVDTNRKEKLLPHVLGENKESSASGNIAFETYMQYLKAGGGYLLLFCLVMVCIFNHSVLSAGDYFVAYWVTLEEHVVTVNKTITDTYANSTLNRSRVIYMYSGIIVLTIFMAIFQCVFFFVFLMRASVHLHNTIFKKITCAAMQFFDVNPIGRILNRISKDVGIVDDYVPLVFLDTVQVVLALVSTLVFSAIINTWLLLPLAVLAIPLYFSRLLYINTSNGYKRIEGITRSPIFNYITSTISGLPTIRAFGAEKKLIEEFDAHQDLHSSAWYIFISSNRAFCQWLDTITALFVVGGVIYFLLSGNEHSGGEVGLLIMNYLYMSGFLSFGLRQMCEFENSMVCVERVLEYTKIDTESNMTNRRIPVDWPELGKIVFDKVFLKYTISGPDILKNINLTICPGEKIGVVGRTGAGKSSLIAALFQMYNTEGIIAIDDIDIKQISLKDLRSKISIIPQQPVLFSGTLRKNLDPFEEYNDDVLWETLQQVEMKQVIENCDAGLSTKVQESGSNFSIGQKQLICFARAIVRKNKILVMDEATANVDHYTDNVIQKTIKDVFSDCTVITIAHRLNTIIDSDKILVIDDGRAVEFDHAYNLLQTTHSLFYKMANAVGKDTFSNLYVSAEESFKSQAKKVS